MVGHLCAPLKMHKTDYIDLFDGIVCDKRETSSFRTGVDASPMKNRTTYMVGTERIRRGGMPEFGDRSRDRDVSSTIC